MPREAIANLSAAPERAIADALLDQRNLAGIGNMYKSEVLFLRGIWPWRPVGDVADLDGLVSLARRMISAHRGRWTQSTTGSLRRGEEFYVYGRAGRPCRRCRHADPARRRGRLRPRHVLVPVLPARALTLRPKIGRPASRAAIRPAGAARPT